MSRTLRVLHVIPSLGPQRGGPSVVARTLVEGLAQAGLEIVVATTDDNGLARLDVPLCRPVIENGVTYWYFPRQTRFYTASWPLAVWLARHVGDYDLVHIHALFSFASLAAAVAAAQRHVPYIVRPLGTLSHYGMRQRRSWRKTLLFHLLDRHAIRGAAAIHFTSEQERLEAADLHVPHRPIVIPLPVDLHEATLNRASGGLRARYPQLVGRTVALFLSRLDPKKGLDLLLPAFAQAHSADPRLALVIAGSGDTPFVAGLKAHAEALGIGSVVVWAGFVEGATKLEALIDADFFVLPSYSENFGIAAVEALAAGLPTILSNQVGIHHEVATAGAGLIVSCAIPPLADAIIRLGGDAALRQTMGRAARQFAESHYNTQAVIGQLTKLYLALADRPTAATPVA
jgi:glycosyltransferase involved in cell wall biosynthesis